MTENTHRVEVFLSTGEQLTFRDVPRATASVMLKAVSMNTSLMWDGPEASMRIDARHIVRVIAYPALEKA